LGEQRGDKGQHPPHRLPVGIVPAASYQHTNSHRVSLLATTDTATNTKCRARPWRSTTPNSQVRHHIRDMTLQQPPPQALVWQAAGERWSHLCVGGLP